MSSSEASDGAEEGYNESSTLLMLEEGTNLKMKRLVVADDQPWYDKNWHHAVELLRLQSAGPITPMSNSDGQNSILGTCQMIYSGRQR
jgi:hypothetical protein